MLMQITAYKPTGTFNSHPMFCERPLPGIDKKYRLYDDTEDYERHREVAKEHFRIAASQNKNGNSGH